MKCTQQAMSCLIREIYLVIYFSADLGTYSSCFSEHMLVQMDLTQNPTLVATEMHLYDINCRATEVNATFASFESLSKPVQELSVEQTGMKCSKFFCL